MLGFKHRKVTPFWPKANREVRRFVKSLKKWIKAAKVEGRNWRKELQDILSKYRITSHGTIGVASAVLLLKRPVRNKLSQTNQNWPCSWDRPQTRLLAEARNESSFCQQRPMWNFATSPLARLWWLKDHFSIKRWNCVWSYPLDCCEQEGQHAGSQPKARIAQSQRTRHFPRMYTNQLLTMEMMSLRTVALSLQRARSVKSNLYIMVTLGKWPGDRYIQGDRCTQVSFKLPWKSMNSIFMCK